MKSCGQILTEWFLPEPKEPKYGSFTFRMMRILTMAAAKGDTRRVYLKGFESLDVVYIYTQLINNLGERFQPKFRAGDWAITATEVKLMVKEASSLTIQHNTKWRYQPTYPNTTRNIVAILCKLGKVLLIASKLFIVELGNRTRILPLELFELRDEIIIVLTPLCRVPSANLFHFSSAKFSNFFQIWIFQ